MDNNITRSGSLPYEQQKMINAATELHAKGLELHWLHPKSKRPIGNGWQNHAKRSISSLQSGYRQDYNLGVRTGVWSQPTPGMALVVIDKDVKSTDPRHAMEAQAVVEQLLEYPQLYPSTISGRGNGSSHYYALADALKCPQNQKIASSKERVQVTIDGKAVLRPAWKVS